MKIPKEVTDYWKLCGMTKQDVLELHAQGIISFKANAETRKELEAIIKEFDGQSKQS